MPVTTASRLGHVIAQRFKCGDPMSDSSTLHHMTDMVAGDERSVMKLLDIQQPSEVVQAWFERIAHGLKALSHPHIASWQHTGWCPRACAFYMVRSYMPYRLFETSPHDLECTMRELGSALVYLHEHNIVHGHIAPSNLFLDRQGRACLVDTGVADLCARLGLEDVSFLDQQNSFLAPEQREGATVSRTAAADVYALGRVFVDLARLAHGNPAWLSDLDDASVVCAELDMPWGNMVADMLAEDPEQRLRSAKLAAIFEESPNGLPHHSLVLTKTARSKIKAVYTNEEDAEWDNYRDDFTELSEWVKKDLGADVDHQVRLYATPGNEGDNMVHLLGHSHGYYCRPEENYLVALNFHSWASEKPDKRTLLHPSVWSPVEHDNPVHSDSVLKEILQKLNEMAPETESQDFEDSEEDYRDGARYAEWYPDIGRQDTATTNTNTVQQFARFWLEYLEEKEHHIRHSGLAYSQFSYKEGLLRFALTDPIPENLDWKDEAEIMAYSDVYCRAKSQVAGSLVAARGPRVEIRPKNKDQIDVPKSGRLVPNPDADLTMVRRERDAVKKLLKNEVQNPLLCKIICGEEEGQSTELADLVFCQPWLSRDKKEAVQRSLAALQLYLIQGPPGTGKTAVIAEIVLQILRQEPDARILVTSQSNIAVDNALSRIEKAASEAEWQVPVMIRYLSDTAEKKGTGSREYTQSEQAEVWRARTRKNCCDVIENMKQMELQGHSDAALVEMLTPNGTATPELQAWLQRATYILQQARKLQESCEITRKRAVEHMSSASSQAHALMQVALAEVREESRIWLQSLPARLPLKSQSELQEPSQVLCKLMDLAKHAEDLATRLQDWQQILGRRQILERWERDVGQEDFSDFIERQARAVGSTCNNSGSSRVSTHKYSWVIVDEAGRATLPETLIPVIRGTRCIMVGDMRQLPPTVENTYVGKHQRERLEVSLFQKLVEADNLDPRRIISLNTQYRMHPAIGRLISHVFYENSLKQGKAAEDFQADYGGLYVDIPHAVRWLDTSNQSNAREKREGMSYHNEGEAQQIQRLLQGLHNCAPQDGKHLNVGIISGYSAQVQMLRGRLNSKKQKWSRLEVEIATVDAFQGRECDVILYSVARSNSQGQIGFLRDTRRLNVALSRARALLIIVGDAKRMNRVKNNPFIKVLEYMRGHTEDCCILPATVGS